MGVSSALLTLFIHHLTPIQQDVPAEPPSYIQARGSLTVHAFLGDGRTFSIPRGGQRIPMLTLQAQASCDADVNISSMNLQRKGLGDRNDITALYAMSSSYRVARPRTITRKDGRAQLRFRNLTIPACEKRTITILADFSEDSAIGGEHRIEFDGIRPIDANGAQVTVHTTIVSTLMRTAGYSSPTISVEPVQISNRITYGDSRIVGKFRLEADRNGSHAITGIRLKNLGTARNADLQNLYIETNADGRISSVVPSMVGDEVFFPIEPPLTIRRGRNKTIQVRADVRSGAQRTIQFGVEESSDVHATPLQRR